MVKVEEIWQDSKYFPELLKNIKNAPKKLYVLGNKKILSDKAISIVGSRDCTKEGKDNARIFASNIANAGFTIISGMAKGIDREAHIGALEVNGKTIAVLGNGADYIYPPQNKDIYERIIESGGAIVSEYPNGTEPISDRFRKRNRIVSGMSLGVIIVEAEFRSGTSITARYAKEQKRDVFCIPSALNNRKGIGTNMLIQKGATLVLSPKEVLEKYHVQIPKQITLEDLEKENKEEKECQNVKEEYLAIYNVLDVPLSINEIAMKTKTDITDIYTKLFMMELEGLIEMQENRYRRKV